ncbi:hypothetical protein OAG53_01630 [Akkermansiaceae bacterium]|nr:hypothetical protein [Akkermansiaceae bacterium]
MSTKELAIDTINTLSENASWEDVEERIRFLAIVERGQEEIRNGEVVAHDQVKALVQEWTTKSLERNPH